MFWCRGGEFKLHNKIQLLLMLCVLLIGGCEISEGEFSPSDRVTSAGATQLIPYGDFEPIDLVSLLDPDGLGRYEGLEGEVERINAAFSAFYSSAAPENLKTRRNAVQERILGASDQRCSSFKSYLQLVHSYGNLSFGSGATIAGGVGAIVTGNLSRVFSGIAGIFSGERAEFNQALFSNLTIEVISSGIDLKRREIYDDLVVHGQSKNINDYTVEAAVKDAIYYHGACTILSGLEKASSSITTVADPGLDAVTRTLLKVNIAKNILDSGTTDPAKLLGDSKAGARTAALLLAGTPLGDPSINLSSQPATVMQDATLHLADVAGATANISMDDAKLPKESRTALTAIVQKKLTEYVGLIGSCNESVIAATKGLVDAHIGLAGAGSEAQRAAAQYERERKEFEARAVVADLQKAQSAGLLWFGTLRSDLGEQLANLEEGKELAPAVIEKAAADADAKVVSPTLACSKIAPDVPEAAETPPSAPPAEDSSEKDSTE